MKVFDLVISIVCSISLLSSSFAYATTGAFAQAAVAAAEVQYNTR